MTPDGEFREAVARLHRAKDAVYRDAWKRRGEVISILANIARKVDRLEYGLDGAPATAGGILPAHTLDPPVLLPDVPAQPRPPPTVGPARRVRGHAAPPRPTAAPP